jgi:hypothetical protein
MCHAVFYGIDKKNSLFLSTLKRNFYIVQVNEAAAIVGGRFI